MKEHGKFRTFDIVFIAHVENLSYLGEHREVDALLAQYENIIPDKDARYIRYCGLRSFSKWIRGEFTAAVEWAKIGDQLKKSSDLDITYPIDHQLALAERDAGEPESALPVFLAGQTLAQAIDPDELDENRGGSHYGNVGRCLHFMGQIDSALVCYQKSALLIEKSSSQEHVRNQGYIRTWIGELLMARQQFRLAEIFFRAAQQKWSQVSPPKVTRVRELARSARLRVLADDPIEDRHVEKICRDWMLGLNVDARFR